MKLTHHDTPITPPRNRRGKPADPNTLTARARAAGMNPGTVWSRVKKGMSLDEAVSEPVMPQKESASLAGKASRAAARARRAQRNQSAGDAR